MARPCCRRRPQGRAELEPLPPGHAARRRRGRPGLGGGDRRRDLHHLGTGPQPDRVVRHGRLMRGRPAHRARLPPRTRSKRARWGQLSLTFSSLVRPILPRRRPPSPCGGRGRPGGLPDLGLLIHGRIPLCQPGRPPTAARPWHAARLPDAGRAVRQQATGEGPPLPGRYRMINAPRTPAKVSIGSGHHRGAPSKPNALGRSLNSQS
jgi:hypothetical protein